METQENAVTAPTKAESPFEFWLRRQFPQCPLEVARSFYQKLDSYPLAYLAFYERDSWGGLKSQDLMALAEARREWQEIERKQQHLLREIESQGKLTPQLKREIERSTDLDRLEDLYAPFKLKKQSLAALAKEAGLQVLADYLWAKAHGEEVAEISGNDLQEKAQAFVKEGSKYDSVENVLKGVQDILTERVAESFELRTLVRQTVLRRSKLKSSKGTKAKPNSRYAKFFDYQEPIGSLKKTGASHRYLMMRKGWMEDELVLSFDRPEEGVLLEKFEALACPQKESLGAEVLLQAARLALKGNLFTVMENEAHRSLKEEAEKHVIENLCELLKKKLLQAPLGAKPVMGIDPGSANQPCSLVLVDASGKLLLNSTFKIEEATDSHKKDFLESLENLRIEAIAIAHGPKSKEVREAFKKILQEAGKEIPLVAIHEHSSSIYASSPVGKEEFPSLDVNTRRALFVARFLQDPLATLVRLDPKFLSLGEFQHEVNQGELRRKVQETMEYAVNFCGADVNTAPVQMLAKVAALSLESAQKIVQHRESQSFQSKTELKKLLPEKEFELANGFLHVAKGSLLDTSFLPVEVAEKVAANALSKSIPLAAGLSEEQATQLLEGIVCGERLKAAYLFELMHLGENPRGNYEYFHFTPGLQSMADLQKGQVYAGIVTNITSFGVFIDIGIEQDGLVHISELAESLAKNPFDMLFPGDAVQVFVGNVNLEKKQISLSLKGPEGARGERRPRQARGPRNNEGRRGGAPRGPRRQEGENPAAQPPVEGADPAAKEQERSFRGDRQRPRRERDGERFHKERKENKEPRKPKKPQRDPKTGAVVKLDEEHGSPRRGGGGGGGPRVPTKAQPTTFNPFANLAQMLKDKEKSQG